MTNIRKFKRDKPYEGKAYTNRRTRTIQVGDGLPSVVELQAELDEYMDVLLGRVDAPVTGVTGLMEVGDIYYGRATEIEILIKRGESDGSIPKGSEYVRFRTGELRCFQEIAKGSSQMGSRRITALHVEVEQAKTGRESSGGMG